jgi:hypothetical protein
MIEFYKTRDMGAVITDAIAYIKLHWRSLFRDILLLVIPIFLAAQVLVSLGTIESLQIIESEDNGSMSQAFTMWKNAKFLGGFLLSVLAYLMLNFVVIYHIRWKSENPDQNMDMSYYWEYIFSHGWKIIPLNILLAIMLVLGFVLLLIPGLYLLVPLSIAVPVLMIEERGVFDSINRSFFLVKKRWWRGFGTIVVSIIIVSVISLILTLALQAAFSVQDLVSLKGSPVENIRRYAYVNAAISLVSTFFNSFYLVVITFLFFSLKEEKEHISLDSKLETLSDENPASLDVENEEF